MTPEALVDAARLVTKGKAMSLALAVENGAPVWEGRRRPMHYFSMTGSDCVAGLLHSAIEPGVTFTDDYIDMPLQCSTQWMAWRTGLIRTRCTTVSGRATSPRRGRRTWRCRS
jgi:hypothetical protein